MNENKVPQDVDVEKLVEIAEKHMQSDIELYEAIVDGKIGYSIAMDSLRNLYIAGMRNNAAMQSQSVQPTGSVKEIADIKVPVDGFAL